MSKINDMMNMLKERAEESLKYYAEKEINRIRNGR